MVLTQIVMVAVMTMTPIHMQAHGHNLQATGLVIAVHIGAMYLPSPLTGLLVDRYGRVPVAVASGVTLLTAGIVAATAPTTPSPCLRWPWACSVSAGTWASSPAPP
jgi:MFS family permease